MSLFVDKCHKLFITYKYNDKMRMAKIEFFASNFIKTLWCISGKYMFL